MKKEKKIACPECNSISVIVKTNKVKENSFYFLACQKCEHTSEQYPSSALARIQWVPAHDFREELGKYIAINRLEKKAKHGGYGQTEIAEMINMSQGSISKIESGTLEPGIRQYRRLKKLLGLSDRYVNSLIDKHDGDTL